MLVQRLIDKQFRIGGRQEFRQLCRDLPGPDPAVDDDGQEERRLVAPAKSHLPCPLHQGAGAIVENAEWHGVVERGLELQRNKNTPPAVTQPRSPQHVAVATRAATAHVLGRELSQRGKVDRFGPMPCQGAHEFLDHAGKGVELLVRWVVHGAFRIDGGCRPDLQVQEVGTGSRAHPWRNETDCREGRRAGAEAILGSAGAATKSPLATIPAVVVSPGRTEPPLAPDGCTRTREDHASPHISACAT